MEIFKTFIIIVMIGGILLLSSCNTKKPQNTEPQNTEYQYREPVFSNDTTYVYDKTSKLTLESFNGIATMTDLNIEYPMPSIRQNGEEYYTVYSLKDEKLAYVIFLFSPNTGVTFYVKEIVEYPYSSSEEEQKLSFLLPQDLPENILK